MSAPAVADVEDDAGYTVLAETTGVSLCSIPGVVTSVAATYAESGHPAANACDGNTSTTWSNWRGDPKNAGDTVTLRFDDTYTIDKVNLLIPERGPQTALLEYLGEDDAWHATSAGELTGFTHAQSREITFEAVEATGLRLVFTFDVSVSGANNNYMKLSEVEIFTAITDAIESVELQGSLTTRVYGLGEDFDFGGIRVMATLVTGAVADIGTADLTVSGFDSSTLGVQEVTISYDVDGVTASLPATVLVNESSGPREILVDAADVDADNTLGLTYKGFGLLSGNSTSALLLDYKAENPEKYEEFIELLFGGEKPIITHVKIEMGSDRNTSTGPNAATMRTADEDANVAREPGFQLAADAKKYNPDLVVSLLRWCDPGWVPSASCGGSNHQAYYTVDGRADEIYRWFKNTILAAYREYGYMVDYVNPDHNERVSNVRWVADYADRVSNDTVGYDNGTGNPLNGWSSDEEERLYKEIQMVISDEVGVGSFGSALYTDASTGFVDGDGETVTLQDVISVAAYHYYAGDDGGGNFSRIADEDVAQVWNSEAQATFGNSLYRPFNNLVDTQAGADAQAGTELGGTGSALEMANTFVKGFAHSRRTHVIYQPLVGAFYEGGQYSFKELISARDPWSGYMHYDTGLNMLRHITEFATTGWENEDNTAGIWRGVPEASHSTASGQNPIAGRDGGPNYMTLAAPTADDFSTFIVNDSQFEQVYTITPIGFDLDEGQELNLWETRAADDGSVTLVDNYLQHIGAVHASNGVYQITVKPFSAVTVTSLDMTDGDIDPLPLTTDRPVLDQSSASTGVIYADDFDSYATRTVATMINGAEESVNFLASRGGAAGAAPLYTSDLNGAFEVVADGPDNYVLRQQVDSPTTGVGACWNCTDPATSIGDFRWTNYTASADVTFENANSSNYAFIGARYLNNQTNINGAAAAIRITPSGAWTLTRYGVTRQSGTIAGFDAAVSHNLAIQVAGNVATAFIDGVQVGTFTDTTPTLAGRVMLGSGFYYTSFDNLTVETVDGYAPYYSEALDNLQMTDIQRDTLLVYDGTWSHRNGQGMYVYDRTISTTETVGSSVGYTFTGTGLDVQGANSGSARLDVYVDGELIAASAPTWSNGDWRHTFSLQGLPYGEHAVELVLANAEEFAVDTISVVSEPPVQVPDVSALQEAYDTVSDITEGDAAQPEQWRLLAANKALVEEILAADDAAGVDAVGVSQSIERLNAAALAILENQRLDVSLGTWQIGGPLPTTVEIEGETVPVTWNQSSVFALRDVVPFSSGTVTGSAVTAGVRWYVVGEVSTVVPENVVYLIDSGREGLDSDLYDEVLELQGELFNTVPDQQWDGASTGSSWGYATTASGFGAGTADDWGSSFVGADYNQPVTYSLTLPEGTYRVGTVQAPRAVETPIYSVIRLDGQVLSERRNDVAETTSQTIEHTFTVPAGTEGADAVVQVEFGTNATSGWNARLALVWVTLVSESADEEDLEALRDEIAAAEALDEVGYTAGSWAGLAAAIAAANAVLDQESPTVDDVATARQNLSAAITALVEVATVNVCVQAGTTVSATFHETAWGNYPAGNACDGNDSTVWSTWAPGDEKVDEVTFTAEFQGAWTVDRVAFTNTEGTPTSVRIEYRDADGDWHSTEPGTATPAATGVQTVIDIAPVEATAVRLVFATPGSYLKIPEIRIFGTEVEDTSVDTAALEEAIAQAEALSAEDYTTGSWAVLQTELGNAREALDADDQAVVDAATAALLGAIQALVPADPPPTEEPSTEEPSTEEPSTEEPSTEEPSTEEPSTEEPSTEEPSTEEPSTEEPSTEEPTTEDRIPAVTPDGSELTADTEGGIEAPGRALAGSTITVTVGEDHSGDRVGAWLFSDPTYLGAHVVSAAGTIEVTLPDVTGEHRLAVYAEDGSLIGWVAIELYTVDEPTTGEPTTGEPTTGGPTDEPTDPAAGDDDDLVSTGAGVAGVMLASIVLIGAAAVFFGVQRRLVQRS